MKKICLLQIVVAVACLVLFIGCKKNEICLKCIPANIANLQIARYYGNFTGEGYGDSLKLLGTINYDKHGNPISIIKKYPFTGNPNWYFHYDKKGRLSDYIQLHTNGYFESWHFLTYDNRGRAIVDTIFPMGGSVINGRPSLDYSIIEWLQYDEFDRIVKYKTNYFQAQFTLQQAFKYDTRGNRISSRVHYDGFGSYSDPTTDLTTFDEVAYDNYYNPALLHKVWQFIQMDYSINNPLTNITAISYNKYGFPEKVSGYTNFLQQPFGTKLKIEYEKK